MLQPAEIAHIEDLLVEFQNIFARHRFDMGMNVDSKIKLTPKDQSPAYSQNLPTQINLKEGILVELALYNVMGFLQHSHSSNTLAQFLLKRNLTTNCDFWSICAKSIFSFPTTT